MHSLIAGIANSFTDNLIAEQRYRMILDGLQVTLLITFCAAVSSAGRDNWTQSNAHSFVRNSTPSSRSGLK